MSRNEKNEIALKPIYIIIGVAAAVIVIAAAVLLGLQQRPTQAESGFTPDLQEGTSAWSGDTLPDKTPESSGEAVGIKIPGYPSISLPADQQDVEVALLNPEGNPCYFTFELVLTDTDEVLYTSKQVEPGQMITNITLNRALPAGQYNAELRSLQRPRQAGQSRRYLSDCKLRKPSLVCQAGKRYADARYACQTGGKRRADEGYRYNR